MRENMGLQFKNEHIQKYLEKVTKDGVTGDEAFESAKNTCEEIISSLNLIEVDTLSEEGMFSIVSKKEIMAIGMLYGMIAQRMCNQSAKYFGIAKNDSEVLEMVKDYKENLISGFDKNFERSAKACQLSDLVREIEEMMGEKKRRDPEKDLISSLEEVLSKLAEKKKVLKVSEEYKTKIKMKNEIIDNYLKKMTQQDICDNHRLKLTREACQEFIDKHAIIEVIATNGTNSLEMSLDEKIALTAFYCHLSEIITGQAAKYMAALNDCSDDGSLSSVEMFKKSLLQAFDINYELSKIANRLSKDETKGIELLLGTLGVENPSEIAPKIAEILSAMDDK